MRADPRDDDSTVVDQRAGEAPAHRPPRSRRRWRIIDYPRRGRGGFRRWVPSWKLVLGMVVFLTGGLVGAFFLALALVTIPQPNEFATAQASLIDYADGRTQIAHLGVNRVSLPLSRIPKVVQQAILAAEDRNFYHEAGVSPTGMARALINNIGDSSGNLQGGSTITQQYVKNYYLTEKQTAARKLTETLIAIKVDNRLSKDTILQNYLNTIYFDRGAYGIESAARAYFGVSVTDLALDPAKAAYLAALTNSPNYFGSADTDPDAAKALRARWDYVLDGMVTMGVLSQGQRRPLVFPTPIHNQGNDLAGQSGYLVNAALNYLDATHAKDPDCPDAATVSRGGYTIVTTFQPDEMRRARKAVRDNLASLNPNGNPADANVHVGVAEVDANTGAVVGFYGGADYLTQGYDDALQASGPVGSNVGNLLAVGVGMPRQDWAGTVRTLDQLGITDANPADNPPTDDDLAATPMRAAAAYMVLANGGTYHQPYEVREVRRGGTTVWSAPLTSARLNGLHPIAVPPSVSGIDGAAQWAWTVGQVDDHVVAAVDMYATKPNGKGNRALTGMTQPPSGKRTGMIFDGLWPGTGLRFMFPWRAAPTATPAPKAGR